MDYLESYYGEKKPSLLKRIFSKELLLFAGAYLFSFIVSLVQFHAGDFILQESGELDSVTSYDYILPMINSAATVLVLGVFLLAGFFAYGKDKVKMLRFPMAFCFSVTAGTFLSTLLMAIYSTLLMNSDAVSTDIAQIISYVTLVAEIIIALLFFFYFDREKDYDSYYSDDFSADNPSVRRTLRGRVLSHRFSVFLVVLIVSVGTELISELVRSGLTAAVMLVPDDYIWITYYIAVVTDIITNTLYMLLAWYFTRSLRITVKFVGLIFFVTNAMNGFSFVFNSITNVFSQAGEHLLNSIFSTIFVSVAAFVVSMIKLIILVVLFAKLKKRSEYY